jgi:type IV secretory pathway TrbF-like protein
MLRRRFAGLLAGLLLAGVVASACSGEGGQSAKAPKAFCQAAYDYEQELGKQLEKGHKDAARQLALVEKMAVHAPKAIAQDVDEFVARIRKVMDDPSLTKDKKFQASGKAIVDRINRYASNGCGFFQQDPGQGI